MLFQSVALFALACVPLAAAQSVAVGQAQSYCSTEINNGVHVPGSLPHNPYEPLQHRLAYSGAVAGTGMMVSWNTFTQLANPTVNYGTNPGMLNMVANSTTSLTYNTSRTYNNHVLLSGLKPNTLYYYVVSYTNCANCAYLPTYKFTTARAVADYSPLTMAFVADMGVMGDQGLSTYPAPLGGSLNVPGQPLTVIGSNASNTIQSLLQMKDTYSFLAFGGDFAYSDAAIKESFSGNYFGLGGNSIFPYANSTANTTGYPVGTKTQESEIYESLLEQFYDQLSTVTATRPLMASPGNHEANCVNSGAKDKHSGVTYSVDYCLPGQNNFTGYLNHFRMPSDTSKGVSSMWYSYDSGMVHYISLSSETDLGNVTTENVGSGPFGAPYQQVNWLKADLAAVNRTLTPWVVTFIHRPWYVATGVPSAVDQQAAFEKILYDGEVDLIASGHAHFVNIVKPTYNFTADPAGYQNPRAPMYIVNGAGGHWGGNDAVVLPLPSYIAKAYDDVYSWSRLTFHNATHMTSETIASNNNSVIDTTTLYKSRSTSSSRPTISLNATITPAVAVSAAVAKVTLTVSL